MQNRVKLFPSSQKYEDSFSTRNIITCLLNRCLHAENNWIFGSDKLMHNSTIEQFLRKPVSFRKNVLDKTNGGRIQIKSLIAFVFFQFYKNFSLNSKLTKRISVGTQHKPLIRSCMSYLSNVCTLLRIDFLKFCHGYEKIFARSCRETDVGHQMLEWNVYLLEQSIF